MQLHTYSKDSHGAPSLHVLSLPAVFLRPSNLTLTI